MNYTTIHHLSDKEFKRLTGIPWPTLEALRAVLRQDQPAKGRPSKLSMEDQLLMSLSYWREYRTLFNEVQVINQKNQSQE